MTDGATDYHSQHPRVTMPKALYDRAHLAALQASRVPNRPVTRRDVVETAISEYLTEAEQARANQHPLHAERIPIPSGSPGVRIRAALRARLAEEARQQAIEQQRDVAIGHLTAAALTMYLDRLDVPVPKPR